MLQSKMIQNQIKKNLLQVLLCVFSVGIVFAQSSTSDLTKRFLQRADDQYSAMQYEEAFKTINATLKLSERDEVPGNVYLLATQIYTKLLDKMTKTKDFTLFNDVIMNLQTYPKLSDDPQIQKYVRMIQQMQADIKEAARDAKQQAQTKEMMESFAATQQAGNEEMKEAIRQGLESAGEKTAEAVREVSETTNNTMKEISRTSNKTIWILVMLGALIFVIVFILVVVGIRVSARASAMQTAQLDSTLKLIAGMQQTNNQLLLGGITDFGGMGLKSAGSSRWGVDALPAPEMTDDEKAELKQLVIDCEKLGSEIDAVTKRKNNSKNVSELVYKLAMQLGLNQNSSMIYFAASMVYDAGFLAVPEEILEAENLTDEQREILREHVNQYEQYLGFVPRKYWDIFEDAAKYHHENMDGSGYKGLAGDAIPQIARLIHVAESYNSLISRRNYKQIQDKESAIQELESKPNLYDNDVVKVLDSIV
ncbi:HD domain-containing phosphohydrolase [uncultured Treponema sp.]|uniref:HD-GYP domain-containing protein n=1 Tax=uncultured Treponema sp. TaxID=162155 RepID=UPI0025F26F85|nr:HD domain-containing phosphohydrolase [uncultured Treponema sp.]